MKWTELAELLHRRVTDPRVVDLVASSGRGVVIKPGELELPERGLFVRVFRDTIADFRFVLSRTPGVRCWTGDLPFDLPPRLTRVAAAGLAGADPRYHHFVVERDGLSLQLSFWRDKLSAAVLSKPRTISRVRAARRPTITWQKLASMLGRKSNDRELLALVLSTQRELGREPDVIGLYGYGAVLIFARGRVCEVQLHLERVFGYRGTWKGALPRGVSRTRRKGDPEMVRLPGVVAEYGPRKLRVVRLIPR